MLKFLVSHFISNCLLGKLQILKLTSFYGTNLNFSKFFKCLIALFVVRQDKTRVTFTELKIIICFKKHWENFITAFVQILLVKKIMYDYS